MIGRITGPSFLLLGFMLAGCGGEGSRSRANNADQLSSEQRDAQVLGREIFELVDRAMDYRGSHQGRPAVNLRQMGLESLTTATVRRVENVQREPVITVAFRQPAGRGVISCRGDSQILEDAFLNDGRFTIMCTARSGAQRPIEVGRPLEP
jgi:hypothetical protein